MTRNYHCLGHKNPQYWRVDAGILVLRQGLMLAPERTSVFLKTAVARTQEYKQIFFQLHLFMLYIKAVFTEGHTVVVFVQGQLCFSLGKQTREGTNKGREWGTRLVESLLWKCLWGQNGSAGH